MQHEHVGLLHDLGVANTVASEEQVGSERSAFDDVDDTNRFEPEESCELFVDPRARADSRRRGRRRARLHRAHSSAVTDGLRTMRTCRRRGRRFHRASTLVYALSSTGSWYSSGPITP